MSGTFIKNWVVSVITLFVVNFLWHEVLNVAFYHEELLGIVRIGPEGGPAPLLGYLILSIVIASFAVATFVPALSKTSGQYIWNSLIVAFTFTGAFSVLSYALFANWTSSLAWMDVFYSLISGIVLGAVLMLVNRKGMPVTSGM
ncbi:MAG: hypothetical protein A2749_01600 [Parcubacteria group bacterium RIFCSPHIGHO2_01_FULL_45_26]|nr:MAG: hypothetical protein A2749_01600 [Parcubacteria group bacterium RIFCSPHIGHO2_01_FULL_45_26]